MRKWHCLLTVSYVNSWWWNNLLIPSYLSPRSWGLTMALNPLQSAEHILPRLVLGNKCRDLFLGIGGVGCAGVGGCVLGGSTTLKKFKVCLTIVCQPYLLIHLLGVSGNIKATFSFFHLKICNWKLKKMWLLFLLIPANVMFSRVTAPAIAKVRTTSSCCPLGTTWAWRSSPCSAASGHWASLPFTTLTR